MMAKDHDYGDSDDDDVAGSAAGKGGGAADEALFSLLKDLRKSMSKKLGLPPFVIFQDPSLEDMSIQYPITMDELNNITGVGAGKAKKYGKEFIELIKRYVEENEIERPQDMVVKSVVNKSGNKVFIIQSIDKRMDLEDIANAKGLDMKELLSEMEAIVSSGTRINIDYYINENVDEDKLDEVFDYFRNEAKTESIEEALEFLGEEDYSEEELRLIRIKFMSEMGN
jgi:ATP-dependent DNA helicase RecQ